MNMQSNAPIDLKQAARHLKSLPAMPAVAQKLLSLRLDTEDGEKQMMSLIAQDALISAKVVGLANSPSIGATRKISTPRDAAMLLGLKRIKSIATGLAIMSFKIQPVGRLNLQELWMHSLCVGFASLAIFRAMPASLRPDEDQVFLAGMLHDIGYLVLAHLDVDRSDELQVRMITEPNRFSQDIEREIANVTHDELGAELAAHWFLPGEVVSAIRYHHVADIDVDGSSPIADGTDPDQIPLLARIINLAEKFLPAMGFGEHISQIITAGEMEYLGIDPGKEEEIRNLVTEQVVQAGHITLAI